MHFLKRKASLGHVFIMNLTKLLLVFSLLVWADADTWFERQQQEAELQRLQAEHVASARAAEEEQRKKLVKENVEETEEAETLGDPMAKVEAESDAGAVS